MWLVKRSEAALQRTFYLCIELDSIDDPQLKWGTREEALEFGSYPQAEDVAHAYEGAEVTVA